jgi:hypothetical protein
MLRDYSELLQLQTSEMLQSEINVQEEQALFSAIAGDDLYYLKQRWLFHLITV